MNNPILEEGFITSLFPSVEDRSSSVSFVSFVVKNLFLF